MANGDNEQKPLSMWHSDVKPWWAPDAQGFVIAAVTLYVGYALNFRMRNPVEVNDKLLDMMLTILYGTAFVGIINFLIGASRGSQAKDETINKIALTPVAPIASVAPVAPIAPLISSVPVPPWWSRLKDDEKNAITAAVSADARVAAFVTASQVGAATPDDLAYLVTKGLLTQDRATAIQSA